MDFRYLTESKNEFFNKRACSSLLLFTCACVVSGVKPYDMPILKTSNNTKTLLAKNPAACSVLPI